jgi:hypothetical protein
MLPNKLSDVWRDVPIDDVRKCWPWRGAVFPAGYGRFNIGRTSIGAYVAVYRDFYGDVPAGQYVMHKCNNKRCCNPAHLTVGTNSENQRHASGSGLFPVGRSGLRGVGFDRRRGYWTAQAYLGGKKYNLYTGPHKHKAIAAREKWDRENIPYFKEQDNGL